METRLNPLDNSVLDFHALGGYFNNDLSTTFDNALNNASDGALGYDFLNFDQDTANQDTNVPCSSAGPFQTSSIDPALVLSPLELSHGAHAPTPLPPASLSHISNSPSSTSPSPSTPSQAVNPPAPENQKVNSAKKRRTRRKKAPLPPALREEKRRVFLEKNRKAASKCRERNKRKWDRVHQHCVDLEAQNGVLKERCVELKNEYEFLSKAMKEHGECGNKEICEWIEGRMLEEPSSELRRAESFSSQRCESPASVGDDQHNGTEDQDVDMSFFLADDNHVPSLSSSRKTSAASTDFEFDLDRVPAMKVPSPADSGIDIISDFHDYEKLGGLKEERVAIEDQDEELMAVEGMVSACR